MPHATPWTSRITLLGLLALTSCRTAPVTDPVPPHEAFRLPSAILGEDRVINVFLPPGYAADSTKRFPVLYMPDGGIREDFPHLVNTFRELLAQGDVPPMLVVGIENTQRRRDLTPPTRIAEDRKIAPVVGGSAAFRAFLRSELIPQIERRYRCTQRRGIVGESLAGLFVMDCLLREPGLFQDCIALSPSLWWNDHRLVEDAETLLAGLEGTGSRLFLSAANETDIFPHTDALGSMLARRRPAGLEWIYRPRRDLTHATIYRALSAESLAWALGGRSPR